MRVALVTLIGVVGCSAGSGIGDDTVRPIDPTKRGGRGVVVVEPQDYDITLEGRSGGFAKKVPTRVHAPESASDEASPVVVFNHDAAADIDEYFDTANHLASWGFVVLVPQWDQGVSLRSDRGLADDVSSLLDALQADGFPIALDVLAIDLDTVGVAGHGRGGKQAYLAALADGRIDAAFAIDPTDEVSVAHEGSADYPSATPELVGGLKVPVAQIGTGRSTDSERPCVDEGEGYADFFAALPAGTRQFVLPTAGYRDVLEACAGGSGGAQCNSCTPGDEPAATQRFVESALVAFMGGTLLTTVDVASWNDGTLPVTILEDAEVMVKE